MTPALRGVSHQAGFVVSVAAGVLLVAQASGAAAVLAATVFALAVALMFAASALYHRIAWSPAARRRMRRVDHAGILLLVAGSYAPYALLALDGAWRPVVLAAVWAGAAVGIAVRIAWVDAPGWLTAAVALVLGWASLAALPAAFGALGPAGFALLVAGGVLYSAGGAVYVLRRPDPFPRVFGFHEVFHALVVAAVACQYAAVAFFLLPGR